MLCWSACCAATPTCSSTPARCGPSAVAISPAPIRPTVARGAPSTTSRPMETACRSPAWPRRPMSMTHSPSSGCSWPPSQSWPAFAPCSQTKATTLSTIAIRAAPLVPSPPSTSAANRAGRDWANIAGRSSAAMPGCSKTDALVCAMTGSASSSTHCFRPPAYSWLQAASPANSENRLLVVHPLSCGGIWHDGDPGAARGAVPPSTAPDEGMLVLVPVRGGPLDGFFDLGPGLEATPFEGQRAQDLPPRLDQVQVGRVFGLKHELPARVGQSKEQHIGCAVDVEVVHHGVDPRDIGFDPALDRAEEIDPVCGGAAGVRGSECLPRGRSEATEDIALAASAVVDLLLGPLCFGTRRLDHASAGIALGRLWPHLVEADDCATLGRGGVEALEPPLLRANSGSTRAPNQVSSWRHFSPSASRTSLTRLRFMPMPFSPK